MPLHRQTHVHTDSLLNKNYSRKLQVWPGLPPWTSKPCKSHMESSTQMFSVTKPKLSYLTRGSQELCKTVPKHPKVSWHSTELPCLNPSLRGNSIPIKPLFLTSVAPSLPYKGSTPAIFCSLSRLSFPWSLSPLGPEEQCSMTHKACSESQAKHPCRDSIRTGELGLGMGEHYD